METENNELITTILFILIALSLVCSSSEKPTVSTPDPGEAYRSQLGDIIDQYQAAYNEVGYLNEQMGNNPALLKDGDWNKKTS